MGCETGGQNGAPPPDRAALRTEWAAWTAARDSLFASPDGPLPARARTAFQALPYFPYDTTWAVTASLVPAVSTDTVAFPTSTGELRPMVRAGQLVFASGGVDRRLVAYTAVGPDAAAGSLFVPFRDATSGEETYGGGRYLDLDLTPTGRYALDFNRAYHPYCVYSDAYSCPLPPAENTLALDVRAGERLDPDEARPPRTDRGGRTEAL